MRSGDETRITRTTECLAYSIATISQEQTLCGTTYKHFAKTFLYSNNGKVLPTLEVYKGILDAVELSCKRELLNCMEQQLGISAKEFSSYNTLLISASVEPWQVVDKGPE